MTRISDHFGLDVSQAALDFVDVDDEGDIPAHIDPYAIATQTGWWHEACASLIQSYFSEVLDAIHRGDIKRIRQLVLPTSEPNETHLGFSRSTSNGRGMSAGKKSDKFVERLAKSRAAESNVITDIEDAALLIPGVGSDTISDMITSVIRHPLISYTQEMCELHSIPVTKHLSGPIWTPESKSWEERMTDLPETATGKLLLIPKSIVRISPILDTGKFYRGFLRHALWSDMEQTSPQSLVRLLKGKHAPIRLSDFDKMVGDSKTSISQHVVKHPECVSEYKKANPGPHRGYTQVESDSQRPGQPVDFMALYDAVRAVSPGNAGAQSFHTSVANLISALFEGMLGNMKPEFQLNEGRKRVDITFDNVARDGFFRFLTLNNYPSALIFIECKNYSNDPANESLDQLAGRFADHRGRVGILVCRTLSDRELIYKRCKDTAAARNGYMLVLDDDDLFTLTREAVQVQEFNASLPEGAELESPSYSLLHDQFRNLIS